MATLIASNQPDDWGSVATYTTTAGFYDSDYVDGAITVPDNTFTSQIEWTPTGGTDTWIHYECRLTTLGASQDGNMHQITDASGNRLAILDLSNGATQLIVSGSGGSTGSGSFISTGAQLQSYDWHINIDAGNITVNVYIDGTNVHGEVSRAIGTYGAPATFNMWHNDSSVGYYSQFFVGESDTRNRKMAMLSPNGQGNYNAWSGGFTELADNDVLTSASSDTIGQRESSTIETYGGPTTLAIETVVAVTNALRSGVSGPQSLTQFLRIGSTDYDGTNTGTLPEATESFVQEWVTNPATASNWAFGDLTGLEIGLLSGA